jgi:predicted ATPase
VVRQLFGTETRAGGIELAGDALAGPALTPGEHKAEEDSFAVLHGLHWLTVSIAQRTPVLLTVDDLHWADQPSLRFIGHLVRRLEGLPVALVLTG